MIRHLQKLIDVNVQRKFAAGSTILYQGEVPRSACVIARGIVKVYSISTTGDEQIVMFHAQGEFFPSSWIFEKAPSTLFFYEAVTPCEIAYIDPKVLIEFMLKTKNRTAAFLDYFTTNYAASLIRVNGLEQSKARDKLIYTLYFLCQRYDANSHSKKFVKIPLKLTHQNLASLVGLTRETTTMEMNRLKKEGVVGYARQEYTVNMVRLLDAINEDGFRLISITDQSAE